MSGNLEIIIDADGVKRRLLFPFSVCGSRKALEHLRDNLAWALAREEFYYGWLDVPLVTPPKHSVNTPPVTWRIGVTTPTDGGDDDA